MKLIRRVLALALATTSWAAVAAQHQICFESEMLQSLPTATWGCRDDAGGSCTITPLFAATPLGTTLPGNPPGTFDVRQLPSAGSFGARFDFYDASGAFVVSRTCTVNAVSPFGMRGAASRSSELTGFTTDSSGLVTTGVWMLLSATFSTANWVALEVPADFVAVGGGATGQEAPYGALVTESRQSDTLGGSGSGVGNWRRWTAKTSDLVYADAHRTTVYAIGMRIADLPASSLIALLKLQGQDNFPAIASVASNQATLPFKTLGGFVPLSGGVTALADASNSLTLRGQFVTETAPALQACPAGQTCKLPAIVGWRVESKDHLVAHPGIVNTALLGMRSTVLVGGVTYRVVSTYRSATSEIAAHPAVDVAGPKGYALTGIGASVAWRGTDKPLPGNLIWKLQPRPDLGGATVASKDHGLNSPASITGYALGIKLVP